MSKILMILNDSPYGSERCYNGLRTALALLKQEGVELKLFLYGDAVGCVKSGQKLPSGHYNAEVVIKNLERSGVEIGA